MKYQFFHSLSTSFYLWLDNAIQSRGEAFLPQIDQPLFGYTDQRFPNLNAYGSNYQQWVYNSDLAVTIPSTVKINGETKGRGDGVIFDFNNGRVLLNKNVQVQSISASFSAKTFNIYSTQESEDIFIEKTFASLNKAGEIPNYTAPGKYISPAILIQINPSENKPSSFGGEKKSLTTFRVFVLSDNEYIVQGMISIFNDLAQKCFPLIEDMSLAPFGFHGDLKSQFSYSSMQNACEGSVLVENVYSSGINGLDKEQRSLQLAYSEFDVCCYRFT